MKIAIKDTDKVATTTALTAISKDSLRPGEMRYVESLDKTLIYYPAAIDGSYQPDDGGGWWLDRSQNYSEPFYKVSDSYDFGSNSATEITDPIVWEKLLNLFDGVKEMRDSMITNFIGDYTGSTTDQKKAFERCYVYPDGTTPQYSTSEINGFVVRIVKAYRAKGHLIIPSSTPGSSKWFNYVVDDAGVLTLEEITAHEIVK